MTVFYINNKKDTNIFFVTQKVEKGEIRQIVSETGSVESEEKIELRFQQSGEVSDIFVEVGQKIEKDRILAQLDQNTLKIDLQKTLAGIKSAQAAIDRKYAGATEEDKKISLQKIKEAEVSLNNAKKRLNNTAQLNIEKKEKMELELRNAEKNLENAEKELENTEKSEDNTEEKANTKSSDAYKNAETAIINILDEIKTAISESDNIIGVDNKSANDKFDGLLAAKNTHPLLSAKNNYLLAKEKLKKCQEKYNSLRLAWEEEELDDLIDETETCLLVAKDLTDDVYDVLENTITDYQFSNEDLNGLKNKINQKQTALSTKLTNLQNIKQSIQFAKLEIDSTDYSTDSSLIKAETAYNNAENNVEVLKRSLEELKVQNKISLSNARMDVDLAEVRLAQAKANHEKLLSNPREV
ncbi:MAG: biotin/lipoyl-binding protein, partial [Minisyncoccales bacterium]